MNLRAAAIAALFFAPSLGAQTDINRVADSVLRRWSATTPGCAAGVSLNGKQVLSSARGMANLEYDIPLTPSSIFESGSVAKQFTSAALALLEIEGRLSLDDDVRRHLPELPDFGEPITIRQMLTHTSGLRDQWGLLSLTGNPPTRQVHTLPLILHLISRQRELNFRPGSEYLYSNSGYALSAIIVQRVSGESLAQFSRRRFFEPLGMTKTQWRDDFERVVPGRATAYQRRPDGAYAQLMPFTNVYGNGGLLTTVGDLLLWNEALSSASIAGGRALVEKLGTRGRLTSGVTIDYALGLSHGVRYGHAEISHSGSTAGYQTLLTRFPGVGLSIAVLCNTTDGAPGAAVDALARALLPARPPAAVAPAPDRGDSASWRAIGGRYRDPIRDNVAEFRVVQGGLQIRTPEAGGLAARQGTNRWSAANGAKFEIQPGAPRRLRATGADGSVVLYEELATPQPDPSRMTAYAGTYVSPELGSRLQVAVDGTKILVSVPGSEPETFESLYEDGFTGGGRTIRFVRDSAGGVRELRIFAGRVRNVRFDRSP
ncbi:MAG: serine hydrolase domain-containing protein [Gemmatimonadota bacterium]